MDILRLRHAWPENAGFEIEHKKNRDDYIFIHFHTPVILCLNGCRSQLRPHACVIFHKDSRVYFKAETALIHDWMHFEGDIPECLEKYGLATDTVYYPKNYDFITEIIRSLEVECFSQKSFFADMYDAKLCELFIKLARNTILEESGEMIPVGVVKRFIDLRSSVFADLSKEWSIADMARAVMLSESRFYVVYKEIFGIPPKNDIICARIDLAKNLLRRGIYSVDQVAEKTGYQSTFNFIRQFKKTVGMTPGEYKKTAN